MEIGGTFRPKSMVNRGGIFLRVRTEYGEQRFDYLLYDPGSAVEVARPTTKRAHAKMHHKKTPTPAHTTKGDKGKEIIEAPVKHTWYKGALSRSSLIASV